MAIDSKDYPNKIKANLWANKNYTIYFYNYMYEKKRYRGLIDLSDKVAWNKRDRISVAEARLIEIKNKTKEDIIDQDITLDQYQKKQYKFLKNTPWKTKKQSHYDRYLSPMLGKKKVTKILQTHIKDAISHQEELGLSPRTIMQTLEILNPIFKSAIADRIIVHNPCSGIKITRPNTKKIVSDASTILSNVYKVIMDEFDDDPFYKSLFLFALQGRRKSEILHLKWENVNFEHDYYILRDTKNDEDQKIYLPPIIKVELKKFISDTEYVFTSRVTGNHLVNIEKTTKRLKKRLGKEFSLHYLRNVIVSAMAEQGVDAIHLSGALGHNDPNTITKYLTLNYLKGSELASGIIDGIVSK